ncbi:MBL fold metallo-hydrolase [Numidum massiliense]|uniref:hypothetical protein n=1 Tax=Numidum massiliense TaxID=1522315 RepID=UPI0006D55E28|nr:hypothetical protein [Numidum massiliense]
MTIESLNVEEFVQQLTRPGELIVQEIGMPRARQWQFKSGRLVSVREQDPQEVEYPQGADVFFVCEDSESCRQYARGIADSGVRTYFLAGGHLAWSQYFYDVVVGFDEQIKVWQIHRLAKGCLSYMVAAGEQALVVDPAYHIDYYLGLAHREKTSIKAVVDTTVHRDHVSGGARLAAKTGSPYYVARSGGTVVSPESTAAESEATHDVDLKMSHADRPASIRGNIQSLTQQATLPLGLAHIEVIPFPTEHAAGLLVNEKFLLSGNEPLRPDMLQHEDKRDVRDTVIVLPAHTETFAYLNAHGMVATTLGDIRDKQNMQRTPITVSEPKAAEHEIYEINLQQKKIDLAQATQLELGRTER